VPDLLGAGLRGKIGGAAVGVEMVGVVTMAGV
jgi:hypothetical protein